VAVSPGVKQPEREADHSPPSSAEVKNHGAIPPLPHTSPWQCLINQAQGQLKDNAHTFSDDCVTMNMKWIVVWKTIVSY
jgi:hypothetical protein